MNINDYMKQQAEQQSEKEQKQDAIETDPEKKWMNVQQIGGPVADERALPGEVADKGALPGPVEDADEDNVIDGDFREIGDNEGDGFMNTPESGEEMIEDGEDDGYSYDEPKDDREDE